MFVVFVCGIQNSEGSPSYWKKFIAPYCKQEATEPE